jgi:hypothetical protein
VEAWLTHLGLVPLARAERDGIVSWDLVLDGRRRPRIPLTLIYDPQLVLVLLVHFAPPLQDGHRRIYRQLLRWNDEYPFVKFALAEDERPLLVAEVAPEALTSFSLGLAIARLVAVADRLWEAGDWLWGRGPRPAPPPPSGPGVELVRRFATELGELVEG